VNLDDARTWALSLPEAGEEDHHGMASFRVRGRIFATVPDSTHVRVMVDEMDIRAAVAAHPRACVEFHWGERLACVVVDLDRATPRLVQELITAAWSRKAPRTLARQLASSTPGGSRRPR